MKAKVKRQVPIMMNILPDIQAQFHLNSANQDDTLYHYTGIDGFMSILDNRDLWVSNILYMNDAKEFKNGLEICIEILKEQLDSSLSEKHRKYYERILKICDDGKSGGMFGISSKDIFSICFCDNEDILTQWQFYGQGGISIGLKNNVSSIENGIALMNEDQYLEEIKTVEPDQMMPHDELRLFVSTVIYDDCLKKQVIGAILQKGIEFIDDYDDDETDLAVKGVSDALYYYFALMKDNHFAHEHEKRMLIVTEHDASHIHFRRRNDILLPYLRMKILDLNCRPHQVFPIEKITIAPGPQQEYVAQSVKYYLRKRGYEYLADKVKMSEIPYRE